MTVNPAKQKSQRCVCIGSKDIKGRNDCYFDSLLVMLTSIGSTCDSESLIDTLMVFSSSWLCWLYL